MNTVCVCVCLCGCGCVCVCVRWTTSVGGKNLISSPSDKSETRGQVLYVKQPRANCINEKLNIKVFLHNQKCDFHCLTR